MHTLKNALRVIVGAILFVWAIYNLIVFFKRRKFDNTDEGKIEMLIYFLIAISAPINIISALEELLV